MSRGWPFELIILTFQPTAGNVLPIFGMLPNPKVRFAELLQSRVAKSRAALIYFGGLSLFAVCDTAEARYHTRASNGR